MSSVFTALFGRFFYMFIPIWIYRITNDAEFVPLGSTFASLGAILMSFLAGFIVDSFSKKNVFILSNLSLALIFFSFIIFNFKNIYFLYASIFIIIGLTKLIYTTRVTLINQMVEGDDLLKVNSRLGLIFSCSLLIAPLITSLKVNDLSLNIIYTIFFIFFIVTTVLASGIKNPLNYTFKVKKKKLTAVSSFKVVFNNKVLKYNIIFFSVLTIAAQFYTSLIYLFIGESFQNNEGTFALLIAIQGGGSIISNFFMDYLKNKLSYFNLIFFSCIMVGIAEISYLIFPNTILMFIMIFIAGFFNQIVMIFTSFMFQEKCSKDILGQAISVRQTISNLTAISASLLCALLIVFFDARSILIGSLILLIPTAASIVHKFSK
ncbi:MFS transporter [Bacillus wiedmannii]|uniref:MFS transporter n=1 Tax=Bacillus wiedmannii TaxID=1890302 RepID=UPI000BF79ED1|nr:MFS transporter [Bacillus wiedmannii]PFZ92285.1 hypothetical protein COL83_16965 [Bacillus wiedmannii]